MDNNNITISNSSGGPLTDSYATDKLMYCYWGIRILVYIFFFLVCSGQTYHEAKITFTKKTLSTRFLVFLSESLFCLFRIIGDIVRYTHPLDYRVGSWWYWCFSWGVYFVVTTWVFVAELWMKILYTFLIKDEIQFKNSTRVRMICFSLVGIYFLWQVAITTLSVSTNTDWSYLEAGGFFVFLVLFGAIVTINGIQFVRMAKKGVSIMESKTFARTIRNTKIMIYTAFAVIILTIMHDVVFIFILDQHTYKYFPAEVSITNFIDVGQMIVILVVLGGSNLKNYVLFKRTILDYESGTRDVSFTNLQTSNNKTNYHHHHHHSNESKNVMLTTAPAISFSLSNDDEKIDDESNIENSKNINDITIDNDIINGDDIIVGNDDVINVNDEKDNSV